MMVRHERRGNHGNNGCRNAERPPDEAGRPRKYAGGESLLSARDTRRHRLVDILDFSARPAASNAKASFFSTSFPTFQRRKSRLTSPIAPASLDVDPFAITVFTINNHLADVNADADVEPFLLRQGGVALGHSTLKRHGALDSINHAAELDEEAIAHQLEICP